MNVVTAKSPASAEFEISKEDASDAQQNSHETELLAASCELNE